MGEGAWRGVRPVVRFNPPSLAQVCQRFQFRRNNHSGLEGCLGSVSADAARLLARPRGSIAPGRRGGSRHSGAAERWWPQV
eukprot:scaffold123500_cov63-Phaeocystis_antarctica.AAC.4